MERRQLEYFLAVADLGSFTAAAAAQRVAQPSLSQALKALEREVGTPLFRRLPRGVALTPAGTALVAPARQVARDLQTARAAVQEVIGLQGGTLDLATLPALTLDPLAPVLGEFRQDHPEVALSISEPEQSALVHELVRTGEAELGFSDFRPAANSDLESQPLCDQLMWAVFPPDAELVDDDPVDWQTLLDHGLVAGQPGTLVRDLVGKWARKRNVQPPRLAIELGRRETALYLILAGCGVAAFPEALARFAESLGAVVRPISDAPIREISVCHRVGELSPAARTFLDLIRRATAAA